MRGLFACFRGGASVACSRVYVGIWLSAWMCVGFIGTFAGGVLRKFCGDTGERRVSEMVIELCLVCEVVNVTWKNHSK